MKKEKTQAQIEAELAKKKAQEQRRSFKSLITKGINACKAIGTHAVQRQIEFLINSNTDLPNKELSKELNVKGLELGLNAYVKVFLRQKF